MELKYQVQSARPVVEPPSLSSPRIWSHPHQGSVKDRKALALLLAPKTKVSLVNAQRCRAPITGSSVVGRDGGGTQEGEVRFAAMLRRFTWSSFVGGAGRGTQETEVELPALLGKPLHKHRSLIRYVRL